MSAPTFKAAMPFGTVEVKYQPVSIPGFETIKAVAHRPICGHTVYDCGIVVSEYSTGRTISPATYDTLSEAIEGTRQRLSIKGLSLLESRMKTFERIND
jgi:hypothetical protein